MFTKDWEKLYQQWIEAHPYAKDDGAARMAFVMKNDGEVILEDDQSTFKLPECHMTGYRLKLFAEGYETGYWGMQVWLFKDPLYKAGYTGGWIDNFLGYPHEHLTETPEEMEKYRAEMAATNALSKANAHFDKEWKKTKAIKERQNG